MSIGKRRKSKDISIFAPIVIVGTSWLVRKLILGTRKKVDRNRADISHKKREDSAWQFGITIALAATEIILTSLLSKSQQKPDSDQETDKASTT